MTTLHQYPDSNVALLIGEDEHRPFNSLQDYDEFLANALSVDHSSSALRNMVTKNLTKDNTWIAYLVEELETNIGAYNETLVDKARRNWELESSLMEGTHGKTLHVDFKTMAWEIFQARWLPLYKGYVQWMENRLEECDYTELEEHFQEIDRFITYSAFDFFSGFDCDMGERVAALCDEGSVEKLTKDWIKHIENKLALEQQHYDTTDLDEMIEFFHEMAMCSNIFELCTPDGEPQMQVFDVMRETAVDLYYRKNPMVSAAQISEGQYDYSIHVYDKDSSFSGSDFLDEVNVLIMGTDEQRNNFENNLNQFLNGSWYYGQTIQIIPQEDLSKYKPADLEKFEDFLYIELDETCGGFDSEESAIEHFKPN